MDFLDCSAAKLTAMLDTPSKRLKSRPILL